MRLMGVYVRSGDGHKENIIVTTLILKIKSILVLSYGCNGQQEVFWILAWGCGMTDAVQCTVLLNREKGKY